MNKTISLTPGATVVKDNKHYVITHNLDLEAVLATESETGKDERLLIRDCRCWKYPPPTKPKDRRLPLSTRRTGKMLNDAWASSGLYLGNSDEHERR